MYRVDKVCRVDRVYQVYKGLRVMRSFFTLYLAASLLLSLVVSLSYTVVVPSKKPVFENNETHELFTLVVVPSIKIRQTRTLKLMNNETHKLLQQRINLLH